MDENEISIVKTHAFTVIGFLVMLVGTVGAGLTTYLAYVQQNLWGLVASSLGYLIVGATVAQVIIQITKGGSSA